MDVYKAGKVTTSNAIGTGIADDKSIYPPRAQDDRVLPGREPILNNVPTYVCRDKGPGLHPRPPARTGGREVHGAGGYGTLVGPAASKAEIEAFRAQLIANPRNYIAQPTLSLSTCPTYRGERASPCATSTCGPSCSQGKSVRMVPGGLTRVALKEGSLVVNSSQGGGTKDTWVLED